MRCFFHGDVEAVAVCKSCGRAICHDCSMEIGNSIGCRNRCETDVQAIDALRHRGTNTYKVLPQLYYGLAIVLGLLALRSLVGALFSLRTEHPDFDGLFYGLVVIVFSILCFAGARRFKK